MGWKAFFLGGEKRLRSQGRCPKCLEFTLDKNIEVVHDTACEIGYAGGGFSGAGSNQGCEQNTITVTNYEAEITRCRNKCDYRHERRYKLLGTGREEGEIIPPSRSA
jgi:hypothetical protein